MKALVWAVALVLIVGWTGMAGLAVVLLDGLGHWLGSAGGDWTNRLTEWPVPAWLSLWVDPAVVRSLQAALADVVSWVGPWWPSADTLSTLVTVAVVVVWAMGALALMALAALAHVVMGRLRRRPMPAVHA